MQFSIKRMMLFTGFIGLVLAATFAMPPIVGLPLLTAISIFVLPAFTIVGAVHCRGARQSFFLGALATGIPHYLISIYLAFTVFPAVFSEPSLLSEGLSSEYGFPIQGIHLVGIVAGALGGLSGVGAYFLFANDKARNTHSGKSKRDNAVETLSDDTDLPIDEPSASDGEQGSAVPRHPK